jgi:hypothetical protein
MHGLILPVRGSIEGFSASALGLLGTGWAIGYVAGCLISPRLVGAVGHIRTFGVMCALAAVAVLLQALIVETWAWIPVRAVSGFCFAGAAMIVESWLNDRAQPNTRGHLRRLHHGQSRRGDGGADGDIAGRRDRVPVLRGRGHRLLPRAGADRAVDLGLARAADIGAARPRALWRNSPVAVAAVFLVGVSNASFGTLAAVYADGVG